MTSYGRTSVRSDHVAQRWVTDDAQLVQISRYDLVREDCTALDVPQWRVEPQFVVPVQAWPSLVQYTPERGARASFVTD